MKRFAAAFALICCLSFPVLAGHRPVGDAYCDCGTPGCIEDYPGECGARSLVLSTQESGSSSDATAEVGILLVALLLWLRLKA
jgi:hypothetical protein